MSSIAGAELNQAQTQVSISTTVLKKSFESDQEFASALKETAEKAPPADGTGKTVDVTA